MDELWRVLLKCIIPAAKPLLKTPEALPITYYGRGRLRRTFCCIGQPLGYILRSMDAVRQRETTVTIEDILEIALIERLGGGRNGVSFPRGK
jgi:hypothetical protein